MNNYCNHNGLLVGGGSNNYANLADNGSNFDEEDEMLEELEEQQVRTRMHARTHARTQDSIFVRT